MIKNLTHQEIFDGVKAGDPKIFGIFYKQYYTILLSFVEKGLVREVEPKEIAADIVSRAFEKFWPKKDTPANYTAMISYLYEIVKNETRNYINSQKNHNKVHKELAYGSPNPEAEFFKERLRAEISYEILMEIKKNFSKRDILVFKLHYYEGRTLPDIAQITQIKERTLKDIKTRILMFLRNILDKEDFYNLALVYFYITKYLYFNSLT